MGTSNAIKKTGSFHPSYRSRKESQAAGTPRNGVLASGEKRSKSRQLRTVRKY